MDVSFQHLSPRVSPPRAASAAPLRLPSESRL
jgi:hypothetical protein